ncbi:S8 family peptidase [Paenibacillus solisilvae]|uniref:S8 family peptidase n=1 Tax=Paenibacillus solisilvae TaxID=2486751 RepID=A0ABW0W3E3_9BACL
MPKLERLLRSCSVSSASNLTTRRLIGLKHRSHYKSCIQELSKHGIKPSKKMPGGHVICCHIDKRRMKQLQSLTEHPSVKYVEPDFKISAHGLGVARSAPKRITTHVPSTRRMGLPAATSTTRVSQKSKPLLKGNIYKPSAACPAGVTWNVCRVQAPDVWSDTRGNGVGIGIIDTGIAKHPDLRISGGVNTIDGSSFLDDNGHGTHVAGVAAARGTNNQIPGVAPKAKLYAVKALDANGEGYVSDIIKGIDWCIAKKIPVINMSIGLQGASSEALREAIQRARSNGIVIVASAGNSGPNSGGIDEPASYPETIAVAASTKANKIASYSSRGKGIIITAPGDNIRSTWLHNGYTTLSGTSMASPHVAGGAALLLAHEPTLKPSQVSSRLRSTAKELSGSSNLSQGSGLIQVDRAINKKSSTNRTRVSSVCKCRKTGRPLTNSCICKTGKSANRKNK